MTLTETAAMTKKGFVLGAVALVVLIIAWFAFTTISDLLKKEPPPVQIVAEAKFNILPKPDLPASLGDSSGYTYELTTTTGQLPTDIPEIINVYFISKTGTSLLAPNRAKKLAELIGFEKGPEILSPTLYRFTDKNQGELVFNLDTGNLNFERPLATESGDLEDSILADKTKLVEDFKFFLAGKGILPDQLKGGKSSVIYAEGDQKLSETAIVTLWQSDIIEPGDDTPEEELKKYPIITKNFTEGLVKGVITRWEREETKFLKMEYIFWPTDLTNFSTYPIKPVQKAYEELQEGKGIVVISPPKNNVELSSIYIAYLLSEQYQRYLQPVFVFEGQGFAAVVAAITDDYLEKEATESASLN
jgi:hypothetical protein